MSQNLLICAAVDFGQGSRLAENWKRILATLEPGLAGDIQYDRSDQVAFATRLDRPFAAKFPTAHKKSFCKGEGGTCTLLSGRLFHRDALANELKIDPGKTDSDLYAAAFQRWGDQCDAHLHGSYAVAQWFSESWEMRLARSPLQGPPLHYWREGDLIVAASLPQTIFAAGAKQELYTPNVIDAALRNFSDRGRSYYKGLRRVALGSSVRIDRDRIQQAKHWNPGNIARIKVRDEQEVVREATRLMHEAVVVSLEGSNQPAISLSGGLDSQTIASFALEQIEEGQKLRSYTSVPVAEWLPKPDSRLTYDESDHVRLLAAHQKKLTPTFVVADELRFGAFSQDLLRVGAWPTLNEMNMHWVHALHRQAGEDGCDVMLHAELGDSSISYDAQTAFPRWLVTGQWRKLARELSLIDDNRGLTKRAIVQALLPWLPASLKNAINRLRGNKHHDLTRWCPLRLDARHTQAALKRASRQGYDTGFYSGTNNLQARIDMIAAPLSEGPELDLALRLLHGVSRRDPTAYRPLWEFCASLPDDMFIRDGQNRLLARRMLADRTPTPITAQSRVGIQAADFRGRLERDAHSLQEEVERNRDMDGLIELVDWDRIGQVIASLDAPPAQREQDWLKLTSVVPRGIALARFIRHVEGHAAG